MMALLAAGAAHLGLYNGANWSAERQGSGPAGSHGWPPEALHAHTQSECAGPHLADLRSLPHAIPMERVPSLLSTMHEKWCAPLYSVAEILLSNRRSGAGLREQGHRPKEI